MSAFEVRLAGAVTSAKKFAGNLAQSVGSQRPMAFAYNVVA